MLTVLLPCPRCGEPVPHGFLRLAILGNLGSDPCPSCRAPLRFSALVREFDLVALVLFGLLAVGGYLLFEECEACQDLAWNFPALLPRLAIFVTCMFVLPFFTAVARRLYLGRLLRRGNERELLEVFEGDDRR